MANKKERTCRVCGKKYEYCPKCDRTSKWKLAYCSLGCKTINLYTDEYLAKITNAEEASAKLKECDLSRLKNFAPEYKSIVNEIRANAKKAAKKAEDEEQISE